MISFYKIHYLKHVNVSLKEVNVAVSLYIIWNEIRLIIAATCMNVISIKPKNTCTFKEKLPSVLHYRVLWGCSSSSPCIRFWTNWRMLTMSCPLRDRKAADRRGTAHTTPSPHHSLPLFLLSKLALMSFWYNRNNVFCDTVYTIFFFKNKP